MQKIMLIGYLGRDPEVKYSQQGTANRAVFRSNEQKMDRQRRRAAETHRMVRHKGLRSACRDCRRAPAQRLSLMLSSP